MVEEYHCEHKTCRHGRTDVRLGHSNTQKHNLLEPNTISYSMNMLIDICHP